MGSVAAKETPMKRPGNKCPVCGGETVHKRVEKIVRGGSDMATLTVEAEVCLHCGERLYEADTVRRFEQVRAKLESHDTAGFTPLGRSFQAN